MSLTETQIAALVKFRTTTYTAYNAARHRGVPTRELLPELLGTAACWAHIAGFTRQQFRHLVNQHIKFWWAKQ